MVMTVPSQSWLDHSPFLLCSTGPGGKGPPALPSHVSLLWRNAVFTGMPLLFPERTQVQARRGGADLSPSLLDGRRVRGCGEQGEGIGCSQGPWAPPWVGASSPGPVVHRRHSHSFLQHLRGPALQGHLGAPSSPLNRWLRVPGGNPTNSKYLSTGEEEQRGEGAGKGDPPHPSNVSLVHVLLDGGGKKSIRLWVTYSNLQHTQRISKSLLCGLSSRWFSLLDSSKPQSTPTPYTDRTFPLPTKCPEWLFWWFPSLSTAHHPSKAVPMLPAHPVQGLCDCTDWGKEAHGVGSMQGKWRRLERGLAF